MVSQADQDRVEREAEGAVLHDLGPITYTEVLVLYNSLRKAGQEITNKCKDPFFVLTPEAQQHASIVLLVMSKLGRNLWEHISDRDKINLFDATILPTQE